MVGSISSSKEGLRDGSIDVWGRGGSVFIGVVVAFELVAKAASSEDGVNLVKVAPKAFLDSRVAVCVRKLSNFALYACHQRAIPMLPTQLHIAQMGGSPQRNIRTINEYKRTCA